MKLPPLIRKKTCYLPTGAGWIVVILLMATPILIFSFSIHPFLASTKPIQGEALIIEGWVPDYCFKSAALLIDRKQYQTIFVTGGPLESGSYLKEFVTYAALGAATLRMLTVSDTRIIAVPAAYSPVDRTYASAVAFKKWLDSTNCPLRRFDLCSQATHTRRSALLFQRALGKSYRLGKIAIKDPDYDPAFWWKSSNGVRSVVDETVAYLYALFFIAMN